jgi:hypothetical protein
MSMDFADFDDIFFSGTFVCFECTYTFDLNPKWERTVRFTFHTLLWA